MNSEEGDLINEIVCGYLGRVLDRLPQERWLECDKNGHSKWLIPALFGCRQNSIAIQKLILSNVSTSTPMGDLIFHSDLDMPVFALLCRRAPHLSKLRENSSSYTLLMACYKGISGSRDRALVMLKHGARLYSNDDTIPAKLRIFERCILRCRRATVAFLRVKRKTDLLKRWDQNLFRIIASMIWETRCNEMWRSDAEKIHCNAVANLEARNEAIRVEIDLLRGEYSQNFNILENLEERKFN